MAYHAVRVYDDAGVVEGAFHMKVRELGRSLSTVVYILTHASLDSDLPAGWRHG